MLPALIWVKFWALQRNTNHEITRYQISNLGRKSLPRGTTATSCQATQLQRSLGVAVCSAWNRGQAGRFKYLKNKPPKTSKNPYKILSGKFFEIEQE